MPIRTGGPAPYAPPATVLQVVTALRDRGLTTPITADVLLRASIPDSLVPRTLRSLVGLELIDDEGRLTPAMELLRRASSTDFPTKLAEHVRNVYEEVFQFTDPAKDDVKRVADAFRAYEPIGQRTRMVTLFLGLCEAAGIIPEGMVRKSTSTSSNGGIRKTPISRRAVEQRPKASAHAPVATGAPSVHPHLGTLLGLLPANGAGWSQSDRDRWFKLFGDTVDYLIPRREASSIADRDDEDEGEEE